MLLHLLQVLRAEMFFQGNIYVANLPPFQRSPATIEVTNDRIRSEVEFKRYHAVLWDINGALESLPGFRSTVFDPDGYHLSSIGSERIVKELHRLAQQ